MIDWGLAKDLSDPSDDRAGGPYRDEAGAAADLTSAGAVIGTAAYMPPEQARGEAVDERADVYALGAILYQVLAGAPPYRATASDAVVQQVKAGPPPAIATIAPGAPRDLVSIVDKSMARDPTARYATAAELADELRRFQTGQLVSAHRYSRRQIVRRWLARNRRAVVVGALSLAALSVLGVVSILRITAERDASESSREVAEQERQRADQLVVGLLEDRGRRELLDGNRERAAVYLSAAFSRGADSPAMRFMLADAMTAFDGEVSRLDFAGATHAAFDHGGRRVVVTDGKRAAVFEVATGIRVAELDGSPAGFSSDDAWLFGSRDDGTLLRWDVAGGKPASVVAHRSSMKITALHDDRVATTGQDGALKIWDARTLTLLAESVHDNTSALLVSPDNRHLVSVGFDGTATVRDARTAQPVRELRGASRLLALYGDRQFSPDGKRLVLGDLDGTVTIWDVERGTTQLTLAGHGGVVMPQFDPTGSRLLVVDARRDAYIADAATGRRLARIHGDAPMFLARYSADGTRVFGFRITAAPATGTIDVLDAASGALLLRREATLVGQFEDEVTNQIAIAAGDHVQIIRPTTGRLVRVLSQPGLIGNGLMPDGRHVMTQTGATGSTDERRWIWDLNTTTSVPLAMAAGFIETSSDGSRQVVRTSAGAELRDAKGAVIAALGDVDTANIHITPDDRGLVIADGQGLLRVLDPTTGKATATISGHRTKLVALGCSRTGRCATLDRSGQLHAWTLDGLQLASCRPSDGRAAFLRISRDGTRMVVTVASPSSSNAWQPVLYAVEGCREIASLGAPSKDREVKVDFGGSHVLIDHTVWDANDGHRVADIPATGETELELARDGAHVATGSWSSHAKVWSVADGRTLTAVDVDGLMIQGRFSTDGTLFFAANAGGTVDVVDVANGRVLSRLPVAIPSSHVKGQNEVNMDVFFSDLSEDGHSLVTIGPDRAARVWSLARETRKPDEVARLVALRSQWKLDGATLVRR